MSDKTEIHGTIDLKSNSISDLFEEVSAKLPDNYSISIEISNECCDFTVNFNQEKINTEIQSDENYIIDYLECAIEEILNHQKR